MASIVENATTAKREVWVDISRVVIMLTIVIGHSIQVMQPEEPVRWLGLMVAPIFDYSFPCVGVLMYLFLSGWLKKNKAAYLDYKAFLFVFMPYLIWNGCCMALQPDKWEWDSLWEIWFVSPINAPLWYLRDFAVLSLIFPLLMRIPTVVRAMMVAMCMFIKENYGIYWVSPAMTECLVLCLFLCGTIVQDMFSRAQVAAFFRKYCWWIAIAALIYSFRTELNLNLPVPRYSAVYCLFGVVTLLSYGAVAERVLGKFAKIFSRLSPAVFTVYVIHWPIFVCVKEICARYGVAYLPTRYWALYGLVCYAVGVILWWFMARPRFGVVGEWITMQKVPRKN